MSVIKCDGLPGKGPDAFGIRRDPEPCEGRENPERFVPAMGAGMSTPMKTSVRFPSRERPSGEDYAMNRFLFDNRIGVCRSVE